MAAHKCNEAINDTFINPNDIIIQKSPGDNITFARRYLSKIGNLTYYKETKNKSILWRGQSRQHKISPSIHTRIEKSGLGLTDKNVIKYTKQILESARNWGLDYIDGIKLPDMPLLALLQHNYISTPLVDVSLDSLTSLLMATGGGEESPALNDGHCGLLMALEAPPEEFTIDQWCTDPFEEVYNNILQSGRIYHYNSPYVTPRLRIQRGSFLIGPVEINEVSTIGLRHATEKHSREVVSDTIDKFIKTIQEGKKGQRKSIYADGALILEVPKRTKEEIRNWLLDAAGLEYSYIYPEPINNRFYEEFRRANGRTSLIY